MDHGSCDGGGGHTGSSGHTCDGHTAHHAHVEKSPDPWFAALQNADAGQYYDPRTGALGTFQQAANKQKDHTSMPKSTWNWFQQPYYLCLMIFDAFAVLTEFVLNTASTGGDSDFYLVMLAVYLVSFTWSLIYLIHCWKGGSEDDDMKLAELPMGKGYYYALVALGCVYRGYAGYEMNHSGTGLESVWGLLWVISAPFLIFYTIANWKSYGKRTGKGDPISRLQEKVAEHEKQAPSRRRKSV